MKIKLLNLFHKLCVELFSWGTSVGWLVKDVSTSGYVMFHLMFDLSGTLLIYINLDR